MNMSTSTIL